MLNGIEGGLGAVGDAELGQNGAHVALDSAFSDPKAGGDFFIALASHDQLQYLALAGREIVHKRSRRGSPHLPHQVALRLGMQGGLALGSRPDSLKEISPKHIFEQVSDGSRLNGVAHSLVFAETGQHQHLAGWAPR